MSLSTHINPKPVKKISSGVQFHQERFSEKEGVEALKNTDSLIDVTQSKYNKLMFKSDELNDKSVKKFVSDELKIVNEKRKEMGLRAYRPDANTVGVGTFQISDDTLEKMGYDKSKKWDEQTDLARKNVMIVYKRMVQNAVSKPNIYGKMLTATLHVDESTPHVDFMSTGVDRDRPTWSMREVLNGKEYRDESGKRRFPPRGKKLREMQDDLDTLFNEQQQKDFGLHRGETQSDKMDKLKHLKEAERLVEARRSDLDKREVNIASREKKLTEGEFELEIKRKRYKRKEEELDGRERELSEREKGWNEVETEFQNSIAQLQQQHDKLKELTDDLYDSFVMDELDSYTVKWMRENKRKTDGVTHFEFFKNGVKQLFENEMKPKPKPKPAIPQSYIPDVVGELSKAQRQYNVPKSKQLKKQSGLER
ncbi:TPA: hypothetical protein ACGO74_002205 [Streptococcus suis]